jgi:hypothetical protein
VLSSVRAPRVGSDSCLLRGLAMQVHDPDVMCRIRVSDNEAALKSFISDRLIFVSQNNHAHGDSHEAP